jgi:uncharacterized metal-binding protein YceD (DUF177 family)
LANPEMPLLFNIRHLEHQTVTLRGELPVAELDLDGIDELIQANSPLHHDLEVERHERSILVQGRLGLKLRCECVRCLKSFEYPLAFDSWSCLLPLEGEDKVLVSNDCVDLTPYVRDDIVLAFPQHPLCEPECRGLMAVSPNGARPSSGASATGDRSSAWAELNKLKL